MGYNIGMVRKFRPFDAETINAEFMSLPAADASDLATAMKAYQEDLGAGYRIDHYGEGLAMIKGTKQGRGLFFTAETEVMKDGETRVWLVLLKVYKKESQKADKQAVATARQRMKGEKK